MYADLKNEPSDSDDEHVGYATELRRLLGLQ